MKKQEKILLPNLQFISNFFEENQMFICSCCDIPNERTCFSKENKCEFCQIHQLDKKNTIAFTFKNFLYDLKIQKTEFIEKLHKLLIKYKFVMLNLENLLFFINLKSLNLKNIETINNYLNNFFEEMYDLLNIKSNFKIDKNKFCDSYTKAISSFVKKRKRPIGKRILMPCFNIKLKITKRELINLKNILV